MGIGAKNILIGGVSIIILVILTIGIFLTLPYTIASTELAFFFGFGILISIILGLAVITFILSFLYIIYAIAMAIFENNEQKNKKEYNYSLDMVEKTK